MEDFIIPLDVGKGQGSFGAVFLEYGRTAIPAEIAVWLLSHSSAAWSEQRVSVRSQGREETGSQRTISNCYSLNILIRDKAMTITKEEKGVLQLRLKVFSVLIFPHLVKSTRYQEGQAAGLVRSVPVLQENAKQFGVNNS